MADWLKARHALVRSQKVYRLAREMHTQRYTALGVALASMCACLNPEIVAIGGSVGELDALLLEPARRAFRKNAFATIKETLIEKAKFGGDAGLIGAALLALQRC